MIAEEQRGPLFIKNQDAFFEGKNKDLITFLLKSIFFKHVRVNHTAQWSDESPDIKIMI